MKNVLLFGAGKSATVLIDYLLKNAEKENWHLTLADANRSMSQEKIGDSAFGTAVTVDITNDTERMALVREADIVISLLPPALHIVVAKDCIVFSKNLLTASYVDESMRSLRTSIEEKGLLF